MRRTRGLLFVCTGNSCRSQMAEGFARSCAPDFIRVFSAGTLAAGVHPLAVNVMAEVGIDISGQRSKRLDEIPADEVDVVVTLCDDAAGRCPFFPGEHRRLHLPVADPILGEGTEEERLSVFREARDEIRALACRVVDEIVEEERAESD